MASIFDNLGQGLQNAGAILSPAVADRQAYERQQVLPNMLRGLQIANAQRAYNADTEFAKSMEGMQPSSFKNSDDVLSALGKVPMNVIAESPQAQATLRLAGQMQQREALAMQRKEALELARTRIDLEQQRLDAVLGKGKQSAFGQELIDSGVKPGSDEWNAAWKKRIARETAPTQTQINLTTGSNPLGQDKDFWYDFYDKTGKLPPMAWGAAGNPTREQFLKGFPVWKKEHGGTASDTAATQATYKANAAALSRVTVDLNSFEPYKKMLDTNADIAIQLGKKISQTNSAWLNKSINWLRQNASSNPDVAEYLAQIRFVQTEAARVINNPRIVGQLTDEGRKEIEQVLNGNAPIAVVDRVLNRLKIDGGNRFSKMREQQTDIINQMKGAQTPATPQPTGAPQPAAKTVDWNTLK